MEIQVDDANTNTKIKTLLKDWKEFELNPVRSPLSGENQEDFHNILIQTEKQINELIASQTTFDMFCNVFMVSLQMFATRAFWLDKKLYFPAHDYEKFKGQLKIVDDNKDIFDFDAYAFNIYSRELYLRRVYTFGQILELSKKSFLDKLANLSSYEQSRWFLPIVRHAKFLPSSGVNPDDLLENLQWKKILGISHGAFTHEKITYKYLASDISLYAKRIGKNKVEYIKCDDDDLLTRAAAFLEIPLNDLASLYTPVKPKKPEEAKSSDKKPLEIKFKYKEEISQIEKIPYIKPKPNNKYGWQSKQYIHPNEKYIFDVKSSEITPGNLTLQDIPGELLDWSNKYSYLDEVLAMHKALGIELKNNAGRFPNPFTHLRVNLKDRDNKDHEIRCAIEFCHQSGVYKDVALIIKANGRFDLEYDKRLYYTMETGSDQKLVLCKIGHY